MAKKSEDQRRLDAVNANIAELNAKRKELEAQIETINADLKPLHQTRWQLEREVAKAKPVTPAIKAVLKAMAEGAALCKTLYGYPTQWWIYQPGQPNVTVRSVVVDGLSDRELIQPIPAEGQRSSRYELSEHGRKVAESVA